MQNDISKTALMEFVKAQHLLITKSITEILWKGTENIIFLYMNLDGALVILNLFQNLRAGER